MTEAAQKGAAAEPAPYANFEELTGVRADTDSGMPEEDHTIVLKDGPRRVRIRSLTRAEALAIRDVEPGSGEGGRTAAIERRLLSLAVVRPALTEAQAGAWQVKALPLETEGLTEHINALSGLGDEKAAGKAAYRDFEQDPDAEFQSLSGAETGDDGRPDESGDA